MPTWWPRCRGCGANIETGRTRCAYCDRAIPWREIVDELPSGAVVLWADGMVAAILSEQQNPNRWEFEPSIII